MLKILRIIFSVIAGIFAVYALMTKNFEVYPYMFLFLSLMMLVMGLEELQKGRKGYGWLSIMTFLFVFSGTFYIFTLS
ncbi:DUF3953 domain-containing protein [Aquisalibacillus elongatus]|uniref:Uncharacterized protein DUF3953 n=1 Tax=Aquisalibacillus elongatus TaxID=485577 RepID=A0A3N5C263_9BACI|nr:DUF3953 domain-containing protein [Aquisalibacillus elongatus]RPF50271.1 uncharacterized protein DUF3953 [Aquisalibacillus elongatus]